jgi:hypothetical protein
MEAPPVYGQCEFCQGQKISILMLAEGCGGLATQSKPAASSDFGRPGRSAPSAHQFAVLFSDKLQMCRSIFAGGLAIQFRILRPFGSLPKCGHRPFSFRCP